MGCTETDTTNTEEVTALNRSPSTNYVGCNAPSGSSTASEPTGNDDHGYLESTWESEECGPVSDINMKLDMGLKLKPEGASLEEIKNDLIDALKAKKISGIACFDKAKGGLMRHKLCIEYLAELQKEISEPPDGGVLECGGAREPDWYNLREYLRAYPNCIIGFNSHIYSCSDWNEDGGVIQLRDPTNPKNPLSKKIVGNTIDGHRIGLIYGGIIK